MRRWAVLLCLLALGCMEAEAGNRHRGYGHRRSRAGLVHHTPVRNKRAARFTGCCADGTGQLMTTGVSDMDDNADITVAVFFTTDLDAPTGMLVGQWPEVGGDSWFIRGMEEDAFTTHPEGFAIFISAPEGTGFYICPAAFDANDTFLVVFTYDGSESEANKVRGWTSENGGALSECTVTEHEPWVPVTMPATLAATATEITVGGSTEGSMQDWDGDIIEVALWNSELTDAQITNLWDNAFNEMADPTTLSPLHHWTFEQPDTVSSVEDYGSSEGDGVLTSGVGGIDPTIVNYP